MVRCDVCQDDGWIAYPTLVDAAKKRISIRKVACPRGCPPDPNEPNVLPTFPKDDEVPS